jgi:hypothetical protein
MIGKKINQLATELAPVSTDLTIIGDPISGVSKKITLAQLGAIFSGAVSFYDDLASFPATGDINVIYCAKDTKKLYLWSGSVYVEVFPSQSLLDTYQLRSEKGNANGYASLDVNGKVPISQLPSSLMEYLGTWNAATNTPTLANGTGDNGDVYLCNVAGTVDFGAGPITFAVGDWVIYNGTIWERSSGAVGTVTSVAATITGDAIGITGSPVTTSGTLALAFSGTSAQYINGAGNLTTFPTLTGYVPYTGATANVDLGTFDLTADFITASRGSYTSSGGGNTLEISHTSGSGIALNITKGGNGEGLYINKTSGSGNAATIVGTLEATTLVKTGGTSSQFLKADGSVDSSTYLTTSVAATTYLPMVLSSTANSIEINGQFFDVASAANSYTSGRLIIAPTYGAIGYQNAGVFDGLKILTNGNAEFSNSGITRFFNQVRFDSTLTNGTYTYTLPGATGTLALTSDLTGGTVTSVGLSSATSGVTIGSTPITTSGTITLAIATASGSQQGLLSSTDWTTFNNKQSALTNPVTGTGTTNYLPKFTGTSTIGNSAVYDNGGNVGIGVISNLSAKLTVNGGLSIGNGWGTSGATLEASTGATGVDGATLEVSYWGTSSYGSLFLKTGNAIRATLNASGNLGLGVTPSAWNSIYKVAEVGTAAIFGTSAYNSAAFTTNVFYNAANSPRYIANDFSTMYWQDDGKHLWYIAPSGTAGNAISFTQAMTLNASGNLSIGNTNDTYKLDVSGTGRFTGDVSVIKSSDASFIVNNTSASGKSYRLVSKDDGKFYIQNTGVADLFNIASTGAATFSSSVTAGGNIRTLMTGTTDVPSIYAENNVGSINQIRVFGTSAGGTLFGVTRAGWSSIDTNNGLGLLFGTTDTAPIVIGTSNTERMRITSGGNIGIGTTSPTIPLQVNKAGTVNSIMTQTVLSVADSNGWNLGSDGTNALIGVTNSSTDMVFLKRVAGVYSEAMRITSGGLVGIGTTSPGARLDVAYGTGAVISGYHNTSNDNPVITLRHDRAALAGETGKMILFNAGATQVGSITSTPSATAYNTTSDYRLKTDYKDFNGLDLVSKIKAYDYEWKSDKTRSYGVIAHELQSVINYAVTGVKDGKEMQGVDYSKIVPVLIKAIQELNDKIK